MKKNTLCKLIICLLVVETFLVVTPASVSADLADGDFTYTVDEDNATVTGYIGNSSSIAIPSILGGYPTVHIGVNAFYGNINLTSVAIPDSVKTIGDAAFDSCSNLTSVAIPESIRSIGVYAFVSCISLSSITLPENLSVIEDGAFVSCSSLTSINIPSSVTVIGTGAFAYCSHLTMITVDAANINYASDQGILYNKAKTILLQCPAGKTGTVNIPSSVITIGVASFISCSALTSVTIPDSVLSIEYNAFASCSDLSAVSIGQSVRTIGKNAFLSCASLTSVIIPDSVITIGDSAFSSCPLTMVTIPDNVSTIGFFAFSSCPLTFVTIGRGLITIGNYAFAFCTSLIHINFLGLVAPTYVGANWIINTPSTIRGHASAASNFPLPDEIWNGLIMGQCIYVNTPPMFGTPSPANGSMGNPLSFNWSMHITDIDGDLFTWTIQCSNGQTQTQSSATNGTKILTLTTLTDATTYIIWVNATDSAGSGIYTRKWYSFITREISLPPEPPSPSNTAPIADASAGEPYHGLVNETILFNGSKSYDPDGFLTAWSWAFGDHTNGTGITAQHAYSTPGIYIITLTVKDNQGVTHTDTTRCLISTVDNTPPTQPTISGTTNGKKNTSYLYTILSTDADNDTIYYTVDWGDPRFVPQSSTFLPNGSAYIINHSWTSAGRYMVIVIATDNQTEISSNITVYIDALQTGDIGYLLDNNSDGIYDTFYSDELQQLLPVQIKDNQYLLDTDGDGEIEYLYDTIEGLTVYQPSTKTPGFELIGIINAIMIFVLSWKRKNII